MQALYLLRAGRIMDGQVLYHMLEPADGLLPQTETELQNLMKIRRYGHHVEPRKGNIRYMLNGNAHGECYANPDANANSTSLTNPPDAGQMGPADHNHPTTLAHRSCFPVFGIPGGGLVVCVTSCVGLGLREVGVTSCVGLGFREVAWWCA